MSMTTDELLETALKRIDAARDGRDVAALIEALKEDNWKVRQEACFALGEIGAEAVEPLIQVVENTELSEYARGHAILALREIGDERAFQPLMDALDDEIWQVRGYAAKAIGLFGDARATEPLIGVYRRDDNEKCSVRNSVVASIEEIGDMSALDFLRQVAEDDPDGGVKATARRAIEAWSRLDGRFG